MDNHPIPSFYQEITGKPSPSSGMSRAFSELIRGNIDSARDYNPDSPLIFAFFLIQGIQRILVSFLVRFQRSGSALTYLLTADTVFSVILFLYCYKGQIRALLEILTGDPVSWQ
jgi:hypothetical protein